MNYIEENIDAFKSGDEKAYKELIDNYRVPLFNLIYSMINNEEEAEEILQDVFVKFFIKRDTFEGRSKVYTWLYRVAFNKSIDHIRKKEREKKYRIKEYRNSELQEANDENTLNKIIVLEALEELEEDFRTPLLMIEYENYSYSEISEKLNISVNTIKTRVFRARKKLLKIMKKKGVVI